VSVRITIQVDALPEVERTGDHSIKVGKWDFDGRDFVPTADDVAAYSVAKAWFEEHPELVVDYDDEY
jgi:hypothetical protein